VNPSPFPKRRSTHRAREDFVVNKLARPDRGVTDEQDVKSVLIRQAGKLDNEHLEKRAQKAGVLAVLKTINLYEKRTCGKSCAGMGACSLSSRFLSDYE
jgi:hypothetical protein